MTGLATLAVSPVWMPHGRRFERVEKHRHKQQPPRLFQASLAGLEGLATSEVHRLCLESLLRQHSIEVILSVSNHHVVTR